MRLRPKQRDTGERALRERNQSVKEQIMSDENQVFETRPKRSLKILSPLRHVESDDVEVEEPFYQDLAEEELAVLRKSYALYQQEILNKAKI